jgi:mannose-1-phosphate guanylyltransferase
MKNAYAVILAGGSGERFWPLSTKARPKQFISLFSGKPLLTLAVERLEGVIPSDRIYVITAERLVEDTAAAARNVPRINIIGEPCKRDTAPAIAVACGLVKRRDPEGVVCILTADQLMSDMQTFQRTLTDSVEIAAQNDVIVTMGIQPTYPATGFGYIQVGAPLEGHNVTEFYHSEGFVEKPDEDKALEYMNSGRYFWNAGMFIWSTRVMSDALAHYAPDLCELCDLIAECESYDEKSDVLIRSYPALRSISIDYAVMEHVDNIVMALGSFGWDDVGSWPAVAGHFAADMNGNVVIGSCEQMDCSNNIVVSEERLTALIGVRGLVVVHSDNATLICPRDRAEQVKKLIRRIAARPDGEKYV